MLKFLFFSLWAYFAVSGDHIKTSNSEDQPPIDMELFINQYGRYFPKQIIIVDPKNYQPISVLTRDIEKPCQEQIKQQ